MNQCCIIEAYFQEDNIIEVLYHAKLQENYLEGLI
jgi:hypothetical protein